MLSERLSEPRLLRRASAETVPFLVDTDLRADVAKRLLVEDLPSVVLLDPALGVLSRHENDYENDPESLLALLDSAKERHDEAAAERRTAEAAVAAAPASGEAAVALANVAFRRLLLDEADAAYARALPLLEAERNENLRDDVEVARVHLRLVRDEAADALRLADAFLARRPGSPFSWRAAYYRGYALMAEERLDEARAALERVAAEPAALEWRHAAKEALTSLGD